MSFSKQFKKIAMIGALSSAFLAPEAKAKTPSSNDNAPVRIEQSAKQEWIWGKDSASIRDKVAYKSLPAFYKAFGHKTYMERFEMREEWKQKDFLKRDRKYSAILKRNPNATFRDFDSEGSLPGLKLADYPTGSGSLLTKIILDQMDGKLSPHQAKVALEMITLGRPLATVDPSLSYAEQLELCGFDIAANVAHGTKLVSLSARDRSIYIAQDQDAEALNERNEEARRKLRLRFSKKKDKEQEKDLGFWAPLLRTKNRLLSEEETKRMFPREVINGKDVGIRQPNEVSYSIYDEVTRKVAAKIEKEEQEAAKRAKDLTQGR